MELRSWMSGVDSGTDLFRLNMAGTHDCVTRYVQFRHISRCQELDIYSQLCIGIRGLDIRVCSMGDRLGMVHGIAKAFNSKGIFRRQMDMADVLEQCYAFLDENPSETIVFQFKNDSRREMEKCFDNLFFTYIKKDENRWYLKNRTPSLSECRGRIVLLRRCAMSSRSEFTQDNTGIDFSRWIEQDTVSPKPLRLITGGQNSSVFIIQDRYKYKPEPRWNECILPFLDSMSGFKGKYVINYLSTAGGFKGPYKNSLYINKKFMEYPLDRGRYYGMIYMDFPTADLVEKIISVNFKQE